MRKPRFPAAFIILLHDRYFFFLPRPTFFFELPPRLLELFFRAPPRFEAPRAPPRPLERFFPAFFLAPPFLADFFLADFFLAAFFFAPPPPPRLPPPPLDGVAAGCGSRGSVGVSPISSSPGDSSSSSSS